MTMSNDSDGLVRAAWQSGASENLAIPLDELRRRAAKFRRSVKWRDAREYLAALVLSMMLIAAIVQSSSPWTRVGAALGLLGTMFVIVNLYFRAGYQEFDASNVCGKAFIAELSRQRDALRSVWLWYVLPLLPCVMVTRIGVHLADPSRWQMHVVVDLLMIAFGLGVVWLNHWGANRLQREIDMTESLGQTDREKN